MQDRSGLDIYLTYLIAGFLTFLITVIVIGVVAGTFKFLIRR